MLARLFRERGVRLERTSQLNVGGNMDFYNMLERERLESKKISKTNAVTSMLDYELPADDVHIGPSDYVPWLTDRKWAHIRVEGESFGDVPLNMELKLEVWDSPNSAGIVIDAVRLCKLALNHGIGGALEGPELLPDEVAARAAPGPGRARQDRAVHRGARGQAGRAGKGKARAARAKQLARPKTAARHSSESRSAFLSCARGADADGSFRIAQVTPYPWEGRREVNEYVDRLSQALADRGHSVLVIAPSGSRALVRESRRLIRAAAADPSALLEPGTVRVLAMGQSLPVGAARRGGTVALPIDVARTIEKLLVNTPLDFVHVHEPFAPSASATALRHSRALNVGSFHSPTERVLSTQVVRRMTELFFGRLDAAHGDLRRHAHAGGALLSRPLRDRAAGVDLDRFRPGARGRPVEFAFAAEEERGALRLFLRALRRLPPDLDWRATIWTRRARS